MQVIITELILPFIMCVVLVMTLLRRLIEIDRAEVDTYDISARSDYFVSGHISIFVKSTNLFRERCFDFLEYCTDLSY